ncbi:MAG: DEAD/DEAH box helicase, partial [Candidatus Saccharimonadales bacterium]
MQQRRFSQQKFNHVPNKGYSTQPRPFIQESAPYINEVQQSLQWIQHERKDYKLAYDEFENPRTSVAVMEREPAGNPELPIFAAKDQIIESINNNQLTIIVAETGGGKSTQVPQFAAEAGYIVTQTQPRRLAARQVAERIGDELMECWPDVPREISAYHTAEKNTCTEDTVVSNVTDGLLLAQYSGARGKQLSGKEVVIVDEVHEWGMNVEMALGFVYRQLTEYPDRRFVIQSATLDKQALQEFFAPALDGVLPPVIEVPGRMYPVERQEFPKQTSVQRALIRAQEMHALDTAQRRDDFTGEVMPTGFAVTAPGTREIKDFIDEIRAGLPPEIATTAVVLPLHSKMSDAEQDMAMRTDYPGIKIIVTTNVMKTSLTVPGLAGVIDCGYARHEDLDAGYKQNLPLYLTSKADCLQWAGRAGRLAPGWYDLVKMNEDMPFVSFADRDDYEKPASQRIDPIDEVLMTASMGIDFSDWKIPHSVKEDVVEYAKESLRILGAFDDDNKITAIGRRMREFPLSAVSARMMVEADQYSQQVRSYMSAIVSAQEVGGLPLFTQDNGRRWKDVVQDRDSDLIAQLDIFTAIQHENNHAKLQRLDLDVKNVDRARETYWRTVRKADGSFEELIPPSQEECAQIKSCIYAGMSDGMYQFAGEGMYQGIGIRDREQRSLSNRSIVMGKHALVAGNGRQIEKYIKGVVQTKEILESVTVVDDIRALGKSALKQSEWRPTGDIVWHNGRPQRLVRQHLNGVDIGIVESVPAEPGLDVQKFLIDHALENPGFEQRRLREIKKELELLNHLTYEDVPQLTQDELTSFLRDATPVGLVDAPMIDVNLQLMDIKRQRYISDQDRQRIVDSAPSRIATGTGNLAIHYQNGKPIVRKYDMRTVLNFSDDMRLPDGREIFFVHNRREYTL